MFTNYDAIFWDFDGVIKDSVKVKEDAFVELFEPKNDEQDNLIRQHHRNNGGLSRFQKFPIYSKIVNQPSLDMDICNDLFSKKCLHRVVNSDWIEGVQDVLHGFKQNYWALISATPEKEILSIVEKLGLAKCFDDVRGSPKTKIENSKLLFKQRRLSANGSYLVLGDANSDLQLARSIKADFIYVSRYPDKKIQEQSKFTIGSFNAKLEI